LEAPLPEPVRDEFISIPNELIGWPLAKTSLEGFQEVIRSGVQ
jgi:hypothetical protein